ncbi:hypothetical protein EDD18DRAFT_1101537 [Armillaria luteobubalina]|uniref:Uncharacterized protein n=1 Tax=Armillaria luteobubalina TaxID=153913 RepID=A0AA39UXF3_9AGAR|nr:hypothetical protein EDD18DRAFT_1101537 [Armillaria luteobubalina]
MYLNLQNICSAFPTSCSADLAWNLDVAKTLVLWDYLISIDDEASASITVSKFLLRKYQNRYLGLFLRIWGFINKHCHLIYSIRFCTAIMGKERRILWGILGLHVCSGSTTVTLFILLDPQKNANYPYLLPGAFFEICLLSAAAYYGIKHLKNSRALQLSHTRILQESPRPIMWLMFRDSVLYFLLVLCAVPVMLFMDAQLGLSIMSITASVEEDITNLAPQALIHICRLDRFKGAMPPLALDIALDIQGVRRCLSETVTEGAKALMKERLQNL